MHTFRFTPIALSLFTLSLALPAQAAEDPSNLINNGKVSLDERYRYEYVEQDAAPGKAAPDHANAQTLRSRIGLQSGQWYGLSALVEADNVSRIGDAGYNNTRNGQTQFSSVVDPDGSQINQALVRYDQQYGSLVAGRQRINLDNQRFIGSVAWRQNEQTFNGGLAQLKPFAGLTLTSAYIDKVNSIWGPDDGQYQNNTNPAKIDGHSWLFNGQYAVMPELVVTGYVYQLGLDNLALIKNGPEATQSSQTSGLRLTGLVHGFSYTAEYAQQGDYSSNPNQLDSDYWLAELGYTLSTVALKGGYEVLGGGQDGKGVGNLAFQTPLATKHAFQGWADVFLITPVDGVADAYLGASLPLFGGTAQAVYHNFDAQHGSDRYGSEADLSYAHPIPGVKGLVAMLKYADYQADDFAFSNNVDTRKFWTQVQYSY
jgi:hypothetical protein